MTRTIKSLWDLFPCYLERVLLKSVLLLAQAPRTVSLQTGFILISSSQAQNPRWAGTSPLQLLFGLAVTRLYITSQPTRWKGSERCKPQTEEDSGVISSSPREKLRSKANCRLLHPKNLTTASYQLQNSLCVQANFKKIRICALAELTVSYRNSDRWGWVWHQQDVREHL